MEDRNSLQAAFLAAMGDIQEVCVQTSLCQAREVPLEERFYDLAGEVILRVMEVLDGYGGPEIGRLCIVCPETGSSLKEAPMIELHDAVCDYLRGMEQRTKTGPRLSAGAGLPLNGGQSNAESRNTPRCRTGRDEIVAPCHISNSVPRSGTPSFIPNY